MELSATSSGLFRRAYYANLGKTGLFLSREIFPEDQDSRKNVLMLDRFVD